MVDYAKMKKGMGNPILFQNRLEAGMKLGQELKKLALKNPIVLAIPAGGVPVGLKITQTLNCPFDLVIVRKIQFPWTTEAGFGAVASDGTCYLGPATKKLSDRVIETQTQKAIKEVKHREKEFLKGRKKLAFRNKTAILVDDGLATGSTMVAAIKSIRKKKPAQVIVAVPTASGDAVELLKKKADRVITLYQHPRGLPFAVASSYRQWHDLSDEEVKKYLRKS